ncbi:MAG: PhoD-like phosphatase N-terminal domain-containing protein, partial [Variibacter sp.]|nr:PhoD-like phosphatase N-terminal domain-containing protein [Variibacter sp.]
MRRRALLLAAPALALSGALPARGAGDPFPLGVASGEPSATGVVLWTRLAPDPLRGGGMPAAPVEVSWLIAEDEALRRPVRQGRILALPDEAHSVHVEFDGLQPDRWYWYRFTAMGAASAIGRTRTAPAAGALPRALHVAGAAWQQYEHGCFAAHRHIAASA